MRAGTASFPFMRHVARNGNVSQIVARACLASRECVRLLGLEGGMAKCMATVTVAFIYQGEYTCAGLSFCETGACSIGRGRGFKSWLTHTFPPSLFFLKPFHLSLVLPSPQPDEGKGRAIMGRVPSAHRTTRRLLTGGLWSFDKRFLDF